MRKYLKDYKTEFDERLNIPIMNKEYDRPLVEYLKEAYKSLEFMPEITVLGFDYTEDEDKIDINDFIIKRTKGKRKKDKVDYKFTADERYGCLTAHIRIDVVGPVLKDGVPQIHRVEFPSRILVPLMDEDGYFTIKGKRYLMIYQLVDKSTYSTRQTVTAKSLMPIAIKRTTITKSDVNGNEYQLPILNIFVFKKEINALMFYACDGLDSAFQYLDVFHIMSFVDLTKSENTLADLMADEENVYFKISSDILLQVNKELFNKYQYVQSIVGMTLDMVSNRFTMDMINDKEYWIKRLGAMNPDKGNSLRLSFSRMLDETTKNELLLNDIDKRDMYSLVRWIMMNFNELRLKDNLSLNNKRLRCNEYIASLFTKELSDRILRVIMKSNKADIEAFKEIFKFPGDILINSMHKSGVLRFDENINDADFFSRFRWTIKGPHSVGGKNANNISTPQRSIYPSFLGYIDIIVSGNSDPGTSGVLSPFTKLDSFYFDKSNEPDDFRYQFRDDIKRIMEQKGVDYIDIGCENKADFYTVISTLEDMEYNNVSAWGTSNEKYVVVVDNNNQKDDDDPDNVDMTDNDDDVEEI